MYIIIDSKSFKITDRGECINKNIIKKWIKVHIAIDANSLNIVSSSITDEKVHDPWETERLIDPILKIKKNFMEKRDKMKGSELW